MRGLFTAVAFICAFLFANGVPAIAKIGPASFPLGKAWKLLSDMYGIFPMILGSVYVTAGAIVAGVPPGILCAMFPARFCPKRLYRAFKPAVSLMAGIPSIVYGFFGLVVPVPAMQAPFGGGKSMLTASLLLGVMILPTILHREALIATAVVLFVFILIINPCFSLLKRRMA